MLVIISDLHLTDGTSGATISAGAFEIFAQEVRDLAVSASWRLDGRYRPIERIDLVLLGDVLDCIRSSRWLARPELRPWGDSSKPEFVGMVNSITTEILRHNEPSLAMLRNLSVPGQFLVPPANNLGRPVPTAEGVPVPVAAHYLVGNHDWFYHLPSRELDPLRQTIIRHLGLAHGQPGAFAHDPSETPELADILRKHRVLARHGDIFDPINFDGDRKVSSLGDAIVVELLNRFAVQVEHELAEDLPQSTLLGLREVDNVRPLLMVPVWIDGLLARTCPLPHLQKKVKGVWDELVDQFLSLAFVRSQRNKGAHDVVDGLEQVLKFSKRVSIGWASKIVTWLSELRGQQEDSFYPHALAEPEFRSRRAKYVVYGHTHYAETVPLEASYAEGYPLNQLYFNSGTWRRALRQTVSAPNEHEFIASDVMSYLTFFQGDERGGRPFETWSGTLGLAPTDVPALRADRPVVRPAQEVAQPAQTFAPHFATSAAHPRVVPIRRAGR